MRWLVVGLVIIIIIFFVGRSKIKEVNCQINQTPCSQEIEQGFAAFLGKNFFFLDPSSDLKKIKASRPYWQKIMAKKIPFQRVLIEITTRQPVACLFLQEKIFLIDQEAILLHEVQLNPGLPEIEADKFLGAAIRKALEAISLFHQYALDFKRLKIEDNQLTVFLSDTQVFLPLEDLVFKIASLQMIVEQSRIEGKLPKSIDLRFSKPVVSY